MKIKTYAFLNDGLKTILGTTLFMIALQFAVFPLISHNLNKNLFGLILTLYSIISLIGVVIGSTLNNIRLIYIERFSRNDISNEFALLIFILILFQLVILTYLCIYVFNLDYWLTFLIGLTTIVLILKNYLQVHLRLDLKFNELLILNLLQSVTLFLVALIISNINIKDNWVLIFLTSEVVGLFYLIYCMRNWRLNLKFNRHKFYFIVNSYSQLASINFINTFIGYFDRFLFMAILTSRHVALVFILTFVGKMLGTFISPLNSVILSYLSTDIKYKKIDVFSKMVNVSMVIGILSILLSYPLTFFISVYLYKFSFSEIKDLIIIANAGIIINVITNIILTFNIKFLPMKYQTMTQILYFIAYFFLTILLTSYFKMTGFFTGVLIANIFRLILIYFSGKKFIGEN